MKAAAKIAAAGQAVSDGERGGGPYLLFVLAGRLFAVPVAKVVEIVSYRPVSPLPAPGKALLGLMNLRGAILPVFDLRRKFGLPAAKPDKFHIIIVLEEQNKRIGALVDAVVAVEEIGETGSPPGLLESAGELRHVEAVADRAGELVLVLKLEGLFAEELLEPSTGGTHHDAQPIAVE